MLAGNEELAGGFKSIREDLIFWMNNDKIYANAMERNTIIGDKNTNLSQQCTKNCSTEN